MPVRLAWFDDGEFIPVSREGFECGRTALVLRIGAGRGFSVKRAGDADWEHCLPVVRMIQSGASGRCREDNAAAGRIEARHS